MNSSQRTLVTVISVLVALLLVSIVYLLSPMPPGKIVLNLDRDGNKVFTEGDLKYWVEGYEANLVKPKTLLYLAESVPVHGRLVCESEGGVEGCLSVPLGSKNEREAQYGSNYFSKSLGIVPAATSEQKSVSRWAYYSTVFGSLDLTSFLSSRITTFVGKIVYFQTSDAYGYGDGGDTGGSGGGDGGGTGGGGGDDKGCRDSVPPSTYGCFDICNAGRVCIDPPIEEEKPKECPKNLICPQTQIAISDSQLERGCTMETINSVSAEGCQLCPQYNLVCPDEIDEEEKPVCEEETVCPGPPSIPFAWDGRECSLYAEAPSADECGACPTYQWLCEGNVNTTLDGIIGNESGINVTLINDTLIIDILNLTEPTNESCNVWTSYVPPSSLSLLSQVASRTPQDEFALQKDAIIARGSGLSNVDFVESLYGTILSRGSDAGGLQYWTGVLDSGASRESVIQGFYNSGEYNQLHQEKQRQRVLTSPTTGTPYVNTRIPEWQEEYCSNYLNGEFDAQGYCRAAWSFTEGSSQGAVLTKDSCEISSGGRFGISSNENRCYFENVGGLKFYSYQPADIALQVGVGDRQIGGFDFSSVAGRADEFPRQCSFTSGGPWISIKLYSCDDASCTKGQYLPHATILPGQKVRLEYVWQGGGNVAISPTSQSNCVTEDSCSGSKYIVISPAATTTYILTPSSAQSCAAAFTINVQEGGAFSSIIEQIRSRGSTTPVVPENNKTSSTGLEGISNEAAVNYQYCKLINPDGENWLPIGNENQFANPVECRDRCAAHAVNQFENAKCYLGSEEIQLSSTIASGDEEAQENCSDKGGTWSGLLRACLYADGSAVTSDGERVCSSTGYVKHPDTGECYDMRTGLPTDSENCQPAVQVMSTGFSSSVVSASASSASTSPGAITGAALAPSFQTSGLAAQQLYQDTGDLSQNVDRCGVLSTENAVYTLTQDITGVSGTCFTIIANNITLIGNGHRVVGDGFLTSSSAGGSGASGGTTTTPGTGTGGTGTGTGTGTGGGTTTCYSAPDRTENNAGQTRIYYSIPGSSSTGEFSFIYDSNSARWLVAAWGFVSYAIPNSNSFAPGSRVTFVLTSGGSSQFCIDMPAAPSSTGTGTGTSTGTNVVPATPTGLSVTSVIPTASSGNTGSITISWNAVSGATQYNVYRSTNGINFNIVGTVTSTTFTNTGLGQGTYYYEVSAVNSAGESSNAAAVVADVTISTSGTGTTTTTTATKASACSATVSGILTETSGLSNEDFVRQLYRLLLLREAETGGYNFWLGVLNSGASRASVVQGFLASGEHNNLCSSPTTTTTATTTSGGSITYVSGWSQGLCQSDYDTSRPINSQLRYYPPGHQCVGTDGRTYLAQSGTWTIVSSTSSSLTSRISKGLACTQNGGRWIDSRSNLLVGQQGWGQSGTCYSQDGTRIITDPYDSSSFSVSTLYNPGFATGNAAASITGNAVAPLTGNAIGSYCRRISGGVETDAPGWTSPQYDGCGVNYGGSATYSAPSCSGSACRLVQYTCASSVEPTTNVLTCGLCGQFQGKASCFGAAPIVQSPAQSSTQTTFPIPVQVKIDNTYVSPNSMIVKYSLNGGRTNTTLSYSGNLIFSGGSISQISNGPHTLSVYYSVPEVKLEHEIQVSFIVSSTLNPAVTSGKFPANSQCVADNGGVWKHLSVRAGDTPSLAVWEAGQLRLSALHDDMLNSLVPATNSDLYSGLDLSSLSSNSDVIIEPGQEVYVTAAFDITKGNGNGALSLTTSKPGVTVSSPEIFGGNSGHQYAWRVWEFGVPGQGYSPLNWCGLRGGSRSFDYVYDYFAPGSFVHPRSEVRGKMSPATLPVPTRDGELFTITGVPNCGDSGKSGTHTITFRSVPASYLTGESNIALARWKINAPNGIAPFVVTPSNALGCAWAFNTVTESDDWQLSQIGEECAYYSDSPAQPVGSYGIYNLKDPTGLYWTAGSLRFIDRVTSPTLFVQGASGQTPPIRFATTPHSSVGQYAANGVNPPYPETRVNISVYEVGDLSGEGYSLPGFGDFFGAPYYDYENLYQYGSVITSPAQSNYGSISSGSRDKYYKRAELTFTPSITCRYRDEFNPPSGYCGDLYCDANAGENSGNCAFDCGGTGTGYCGDLYCDASIGEDSSTCSVDCGTGTGICGDGNIDAGLGEQCDDGAQNGQVCSVTYGSCNYCTSSCTQDTVQGGYCGDGTCQAGNENSLTCSSDCGGSGGGDLGRGTGTDQDYGVYILQAEGVKVENVVVNDFYQGIRVQDSLSAKIIGSQLSDVDAGIAAENSPGLVVDGSTISDSTYGDPAQLTGTGILISTSPQSSVLNSEIRNNDVGSRVSSETLLRNNVFRTNDVLHIYAEGDSVISQNALLNGKIGIVAQTYNTVEENTLDSVETGIQLNANNIVSRNTVSGSTSSAVLVLGSDNLVDMNTLQDNTYGIILGTSTARNGENNILLNNVIRRTQQNAVLDNTLPTTRNYISYSNAFGSVNWLDAPNGIVKSLNVKGDLTFPGNMRFANNLAEISRSAFAGSSLENAPARIELYQPTITNVDLSSAIAADVDVLEGGSLCTSCSVTSVTSDSVTFTVNGAGTYSLEESSGRPPRTFSISINSPTAGQTYNVFPTLNVGLSKAGRSVLYSFDNGLNNYSMVSNTPLSYSATVLPALINPAVSDYTVTFYAEANDGDTASGSVSFIYSIVGGICGDGNIDAGLGEQCDDGVANTNTPCVPGLGQTSCTYCSLSCQTLTAVSGLEINVTRPAEGQTVTLLPLIVEANLSRAAASVAYSFDDGATNYTLGLVANTLYRATHTVPLSAGAKTLTVYAREATSELKVVRNFVYAPSEGQIVLNEGWNFFAVPVAPIVVQPGIASQTGLGASAAVGVGSGGNKKERITVARGWNLIGQSADVGVVKTDLEYEPSNKVQNYTYDDAIQQGKVQRSFAYYDSRENQKRFRYTTDATLQPGNAYWVYAREAGAIYADVPDKTPSRPVKVRDLKFRNATDELTLSQAIQAGWISESSSNTPGEVVWIWNSCSGPLCRGQYELVAEDSNLDLWKGYVSWIREPGVTMVIPA